MTSGRYQYGRGTVAGAKRPSSVYGLDDGARTGGADNCVVRGGGQLIWRCGRIVKLAVVCCNLFQHTLHEASGFQLGHLLTEQSLLLMISCCLLAAVGNKTAIL